MIRLFLLLIILLFASSSVVHAAAYPSINLATGKLFWTWDSNGDPLTGFTINCTNTGPEGLDPVTKDVANPAARSILLALIPVIAGTWSCTINAYNGSETSAVAGPIIFKAFYCRPR